MCWRAGETFLEMRDIPDTPHSRPRPRLAVGRRFHRHKPCTGVGTPCPGTRSPQESPCGTPSAHRPSLLHKPLTPSPFHFTSSLPTAPQIHPPAPVSASLLRSLSQPPEPWCLPLFCAPGLRAKLEPHNCMFALHKSAVCFTDTQVFKASDQAYLCVLHRPPPGPTRAQKTPTRFSIQPPQHCPP